jgi:hypothetical protein
MNSNHDEINVGEDMDYLANVLVVFLEKVCIVVGGLFNNIN